MEPLHVVVPQERLILGVQVDLVFGLSHLEKEKLFLVGPERTLDDGVLVRARFVYVVVFELHLFAHECIESLLELQSVVGLYEIGLERELWYAELHRLDREPLVEERKDDTLFVPRVYVHDGVQEERVRKPRKLGRDVFDVHLELSDRIDVLRVHMRCFLISRPTMRTSGLNETFCRKEPVDRICPVRYAKDVSDLERALSVCAAVSLDPDPFVGRQNALSRILPGSGFSLKTFRPKILPTVYATRTRSPKDYRAWADSQLPCRFPHPAAVLLERLNDLFRIKAHTQILA